MPRAPKNETPEVTEAEIDRLLPPVVTIPPAGNPDGAAITAAIGELGLEDRPPAEAVNEATRVLAERAEAVRATAQQELRDKRAARVVAIARILNEMGLSLEYSDEGFNKISDAANKLADTNATAKLNEAPRGERRTIREQVDDLVAARELYAKLRPAQPGDYHSEHPAAVTLP